MGFDNDAACSMQIYNHRHRALNEIGVLASALLLYTNSRYSMAAPLSGQFALRCAARIFDVYERRSEAIVVREDAPHPASVTREDSSGINFVSTS